VCSADGRLKLLASANTAVQLAEQQMGKRAPGPTASPPASASAVQREP
jgi:hypothetical protein